MAQCLGLTSLFHHELVIDNSSSSSSSSSRRRSRRRRKKEEREEQKQKERRKVRKKAKRKDNRKRSKSNSRLLRSLHLLPAVVGSSSSVALPLLAEKLNGSDRFHRSALVSIRAVLLHADIQINYQS